MTEHEELIKFLEHLTTHFKPPMCPIHRLVLERGQNFIAAKRPRGLRKRADKQCFCNATKLILEGHPYEYVEGFAVHNGLIPLHHAWCVDKDDRVVDVTWRHPERSVYRGVKIHHKLLAMTLLKTGVFGVLDLGVGPNMEVIDHLMSNEMQRNTAP